MVDQEDLLVTPYGVIRSASLLTTLPILVKELHYTLIRLRDSFRLEMLPHLGDVPVDMLGFAPITPYGVKPSRAISVGCFQFVFPPLFGERDGEDTHIIIKAKFSE